jgi:hypothetical protein
MFIIGIFLRNRFRTLVCSPDNAYKYNNNYLVIYNLNNNFIYKILQNLICR